MVCKECGAGLMDTDQFCPKCGTRVIKEMRCPDCGAVLREGTKFCHKCGRLVEGGSRKKAGEDTEDIPIDAIERNILSETAAEIKAGRSGERGPGRAEKSSAPRNVPPRSTSSKSKEEHASSSKNTSQKNAAAHVSSSKNTSPRGTAEHAPAAKRTSSKSASGRNTTVKSASGKTASGRRSPEPPSGRRSSIPEPPRRKRIDYREEDWEDEDWEDEDDWDEDDWDDEGVDVITIMTVVVGCVLLIVVAVLGYRLYKQHAPKNYGKGAEVQQDDEVAADGDEEERDEQQNPDETGEQSVTDGEEKGSYQITVIQNVNVRDQPSTTGTNVLTVAQEGDVYTCYGTTEDGEWYEIRLEDGTPGYVFHEYISVDAGASANIAGGEEQYILVE